MLGVHDIFLWDTSKPVWDDTLQTTPLQIREFYERESTKRFYANKANTIFVGECLSMSPLTIRKLEKNKIEGSAEYYSTNSKKRSRWYGEGFNTASGRIDLIIRYDVSYQDTFYSEIRKLNYNNMIEIEGKILSFKATCFKTGYGDDERHIRQYSIGLNLTGLKIIREQRLYIDEMHDRDGCINKDNSENLTEAVDSAIKGGFFGALCGGVIGIIAVFILQLGSSILTRKDHTPYDTLILLAPTVIFAVLCSIYMYKDKRDELK